MKFPKGIKMHNCDMVIDLQFGSTGKGLIAGWLAKRNCYDTAVCSFATNAGHTYIDKSRGINMMTQQLPTAISSPTVKNILIGPGALVHIPTLRMEMVRYRDMLNGKRIVIHPAAAIVLDDHAEQEQRMGFSKIGSTTKGVGAAMIQRIQRDPSNQNVAGASGYWDVLTGLLNIQVDADLYREILEDTENVIVEGAQGFSLSMYHGFYPYTTSRDVTPWQIAADCGLPFKWASYVKIIGTLRTFPIRVNNRDGTSGPGYRVQHEINWAEIQQQPELTTVTKLPRRIFTFSQEQLIQSLWHCGHYYKTELFLNFANYHGEDNSKTEALIKMIETPVKMSMNAPKVSYIGYGADDSDVVTRDIFDAWPESEGVIE
jgi:adenylosuccinate synthase